MNVILNQAPTDRTAYLNTADHRALARRLPRLLSELPRITYDWTNRPWTCEYDFAENRLFWGDTDRRRMPLNFWTHNTRYVHRMSRLPVSFEWAFLSVMHDLLNLWRSSGTLYADRDLRLGLKFVNWGSSTHVYFKAWPSGDNPNDSCHTSRFIARITP